MATMTSTPPHQAVASLIATIAQQAKVDGRFGDITHGADRLECAAAASGAPAFYRLFIEGNHLWVALVTADRWLSQSIEQDLVHTGDKLESVVHDELVDQGYEGPPARVEHFRSPAKEYTFRTALPFPLAEAGTPRAATITRQFLFAYEAAFAELGDMTADEEDE